jgi:SAM-dependent methyltransferase
MIDTGDYEIDVEQLMAEIREAVARREAEGARSLIGATMELYDRLLAADDAPVQPLADVPQISLQPELVLRPDDHYHVNDLLKFHDHAFVWNAYKIILKREPDEQGLSQFLQNLRSGRFNKIDVLARLRFSVEGEGKNVRIDGLKGPALLRKFYRVPVLGYALELLVAIIRLPEMLRNQRRFEGHVSAQHDQLAEQINGLNRRNFQFSESLTREVARIAEEQRSFAALQHQQIVGIFQEQRTLLNRLKKIEAATRAPSANTDKANPNALDDSFPAAAQERWNDEERRAFDELLSSFTSEFRGDGVKIREGLRVYLPVLESAGVKRDVLDLGCGRGEWLELLGEEGLKGRGVENNRVLAEQARARGLEVMEQDALTYLRDQPPNSFSAITAFHFVEHLSFETLVELLTEIERTLRPGGLVILETPNPKNLVVAACNFYADPTHRKPVFPETLLFLLRHKGFVELRVEYLNPVEDSPFDNQGAASKALHTWFFGPRDFALIGRKRGLTFKRVLTSGDEEKETAPAETTATTTTATANAAAPANRPL